MIVNVYVIKDAKLNRYNVPFYARDDHEAAVIVLRANLPKSIYNDTKLFKVGVFSDEPLTEEGVCLTSCLPEEIKLLPYPNKEGVIM